MPILKENRKAEHYTPLNGSLHDKDDLREIIRQQWGDIKHPTVDELVKMVLTSADMEQHNLVEERSERGIQSTQLQPRVLQILFLPTHQRGCCHSLSGIIRVDRNASCLSSADTSPASSVSSHHQWSLLLVCR